VNGGGFRGDWRRMPTTTVRASSMDSRIAIRPLHLL